MTNNQLIISFAPVHKRENNALSQAHLDEFRDKFTKDCYNVLCELVNGKRLTYKYAINTALSGDIRARIRDLRKIYKLPISDEYVKTENGRKYKEYFMTDADKIESLRIILTQKVKKDENTSIMNK